jgi:hypothetical protein
VTFLIRRLSGHENHDQPTICSARLTLLIIGGDTLILEHKLSDKESLPYHCEFYTGRVCFLV